ncbi:hypothetical protein PsorP6_012738 [Peronosclerospora sorghi]|uniref:Uncharacterized protein n=1 Tax=Peronosclerospora sorghi TaxID=230839 RepID=A0ACC0WIW6_9STRA|nr:hypothetical protein PsorP6_012738 [Peronosclerospora sorghi]
MLFLDRALSSALNMSRLLWERDNVTMVLDLVREVKPLVVLQGPNDSEKEYIVAPAADVQAVLEASEDENGDVDYEDRDDENYRSEYDDEDEEYDDERDLAKRTIDALKESGAESSIFSNRSVSPTYANRDDDSVQLEEEPSRVTVVAEHCGSMIRHNEAIIPNLHASGIFYYLLLFARDVDEMYIAARLISHIHLRQSGLDVPHRNEGKQKGVNKRGVFSPDPLTRICLKSLLVRLMPVSMVAQILRHGSRRFATALFSNASNPEAIWNANMRNKMVTYIEKFMDLHTDEHGMYYISEKEGSEHKAGIALIEYPKEVHALLCYQYYLHNLPG